VDLVLLPEDLVEGVQRGADDRALAGELLDVLLEVADGGATVERDLPAVERLLAGDGRSSVLLPAPLGPTRPDALAGADRPRQPVEHGIARRRRR
jgi:hypothetical protein